MARKSAQEKFNEFSAESNETRDAVHELVKQSYDFYTSHSHACGYLESLCSELIMELPKAKRAKYREQLFSTAATINRLSKV